MGLERYVVDAVLIEKRRATEIAKAHGISRSWLYELIARVKAAATRPSSLTLGGRDHLLEPPAPRSSPPSSSCARSCWQPVTMLDRSPSPTTSPHGCPRTFPRAPPSGAPSGVTA